jgi:hypothetical protein
MFYRILVFLILITGTASATSESEEIERRLHDFYAEPSVPKVMNQRPPKRSVETGEIVRPNKILRLSSVVPRPDTLAALSQVKGTRYYQEQYCKTLQKHFPEISCLEKMAETPSWAGIESGDRVEALARTWMPDVERRIELLPLRGETKLSPWSDDYWRLKWGATSYRYSESVHYPTYDEAINAYSQPMQWINALKSSPPIKLAKTVAEWSPAEKYDLTVGDESFTLTNEQKNEGQAMKGPSGDVENWMGICHGWAAASIIAPKANAPVDVVGAAGLSVTWYPHDVRAITSLAWANGQHANNFIGGRCGAKTPKLFDNGRIKNQECFDTNPATFHLALGNFIGRHGVSFIMDANFDYEVWNQPIQSYETLYFSPLSPSKQSANWQEVAVLYDDSFKKKDRFQKPLTRGKLDSETEKYDDSKIKFVVGVLAKITYIGENSPRPGASPSDDQLLSVTYIYDLELYDEPQGIVVGGGEWHSNAHPDFLWVPTRESIATTHHDRKPVHFTGAAAPSKSVTQVARQASRQGYPLCRVLSELLQRSSGSSQYRCPN